MLEENYTVPIFLKTGIRPVKPKISVVICTHNPKMHYLSRVLDALKRQTLAVEEWELLLVDNVSDSDWYAEVDMSWHPNHSYIREEQLGVIHARLRGMKEFSADLLVFVDDDNLIYPDYLETALRISYNYPQLGVWGGQSIAEFEEAPPEWTKPYWVWLAIREFDHDRISTTFSSQVHVITAGGCYRRNVADAYLDLATRDHRRALLGRKGSRLLCREDIDLCYSAYDVGLGVGLFTSLKLKHLMPPNRLSEDYLIRLVSSDKYSELLLLYIRGEMEKIKYWKHLFRVALFPIPWLLEPTAWMMSSRDRRFRFNERRASLESMIDIFRLQQSEITEEMHT